MRIPLIKACNSISIRHHPGRVGLLSHSSFLLRVWQRPDQQASAKNIELELLALIPGACWPDRFNSRRHNIGWVNSPDVLVLELTDRNADMGGLAIGTKSDPLVR